MSSLQRQLAAIANSSTNQFNTKAQKQAHSQSLLFEPELAATQSFETIYQVCYEGFEDLCLLDDRFSRFSDSIFSSQSKTEDRTMMTSRENEILDAALRSFLVLVGSHLMLKPAIKAVEWLHNVETTILAFMPFHTTPAFASLLAILPKELPSSFRFLYPFIHAHSVPSRDVVTHSFCHNYTLLTSLNNHMVDAATANYHHERLLALWTSIVAQTICIKLGRSSSGRQRVGSHQDEDFLTGILPVLNQMLAPGRASEIIAASYMIIIILASKTDLAEEVVDALLVTISNTLTDGLVDPGLACMAVLAESRPSSGLPKSVLKVLIRLPNLSSKLNALKAKQTISRLTLKICEGVLSSHKLRSESEGLPIVRATIVHELLSDEDRICLGEADKRALQLLGLTTDSKLKQLELESRDPSVNEPSSQALDSSLLSSLHSFGGDIGARHVSEQSPTDETGLVWKRLHEIPRTQTPLNFLQNAELADYEMLCSGLRTLTTKGTDLQQFLHLPIWGAEVDPEAVLLFTFCFRVCCSSSSSVMKCSALQMIRIRLGAVEFGSFDFHLMIPYLLLVLAEASQSVRREAATLLTTLAMLDDLRKKNKTASERTKVWADGLLPAATGRSMSLSEKTAHTFLHAVILPALENCVVDSKQESATIHKVLVGVNREENDVPHEVKTFRTQQRVELFHFLAQHVLHIPSYALKARLLEDLCQVNKIGGQFRSHHLLPFLKEWSEVKPLGTSNGFGGDSNQSKLNKLALDIVHPRDQSSLLLLLDLVKEEQTCNREGLQDAACLRLTSIWPQLKSTEVPVAIALMDAMLAQDWRPTVAFKRIARVFKSVRLQCHVIDSVTAHVLAKLNDCDEQIASKRRRVGTFETSIAHTATSVTPIHALTFMMELMYATDLDASVHMFNTLFEVLQSFHQHKIRTASDMGYSQRLCFDNLLKALRTPDFQLSIAEVEGPATKLDLVVECVRATDNTQTRSAGLLLLSKLAQRFPQDVLHSVMPIFTIMTKTAVTQDDEYSTYIVDEAIQKIVPLLADALRKQDIDLVAATADILSSFAAAFDHIPPTRRMRLYSLLANSLGAQDSLFAIVAALVNRDPTNDEIGHFSAMLLKRFSLDDTLESIIRYLGIVLDSVTVGSFALKLLAKENETPQQFQARLEHMIRVVPNFFRNGVGSQRLQHCLDEKLLSNDDVGSKLSSLLGRTIKLNEVMTSKGLANEYCEESLEALLHILPLPELIFSVRQLLQAEDMMVSRPALKILTKGINSDINATLSLSQSILDMLPLLMDILKQDDCDSLKVGVLACVDRIVERFGKLDPAMVLESAKVLLNSQASSSNATLRVLTLHCLATSVDTLRSDFIPVLQDTLSVSYQSVRDSLASHSPSIELHRASCALLLALVDTLPFMISANLLDTHFRLLLESSTTVSSSQIEADHDQVFHVAATKLDLKVLLITARGLWPTAVAYGPKAVSQLIRHVQKSIQIRTKNEINRHVRLLFDFCISFFDMRVVMTDQSCSHSYEQSTIDTLEATALNATLSLIFKVNDAIFRPFLARIVEGIHEPTSSSVSIAVAPTLRSMTVFNFLHMLSEKLKSIATVYFGSVIEHAGSILRQDSSDSLGAVEQKLKEATLRALNSSFTYDQDGNLPILLLLDSIKLVADAVTCNADFYRSPRHFSLLQEPLVSQLFIDDDPKPSKAASLAYRESYVIPAITAFASALSGSTDQLKSLNSSLLHLLKPATQSNAMTRLVGVQCEDALTRTLGEEWLTLMPEMLPVISELQEDDDEKVELATRAWIESMEGVLGESLEGMLQ
ncbi:MAG: snoRNA-binding rRNA-processing protein utp10 [Chrysothrix sp. TS-e1954]|nr:MAG: snoRNA-binding rRNA-processing protein utp10 [Chrysothrix sp. TS-e1954]